MIHRVWALALGGYEWAEFHVYRHPIQPNKYTWHSDSGCSCYSYQTPSITMLTAQEPLNKKGIREAFSTWWDKNYWFDSRENNAVTKAGHMEKLNEAIK